MSNVAVIDRTGLPQGARKINFALLNAIPREGSFAFEWDFHNTSREDGRYELFPGSGRLQYGRWYRIRWEFVQTSDGQISLKIFADGKSLGTYQDRRPARHFNITAGPDSDTVMSPLGRAVLKPVPARENIENIERAKEAILESLATGRGVSLADLRKQRKITPAAMSSAVLIRKQEGKIRKSGGKIVKA